MDISDCNFIIKHPMENIPVFNMKMRIRTCILGGMSGKGINDIPLILMVIV